MTLNELQRAALVLFAAREAGSTASLDQMLAICYVVRNRVRAGWAESWLEVIEAGQDSSAHAPRSERIDINNRQLQLLIRDVDGVYFGEQQGHVYEAVDKQLFWAFVDRPIQRWFEESIIRDPKNHKQRAQFGLMMLYE